MHDTPTRPFVVDYKKYTSLSIELSRSILKLIGVWPKPPETSLIERSFYLLINVICYALVAFLFVAGALYVILEVKDPYTRFKLTGLLNFCLMAILKYFSLFMRDGEIRKCVECIESDWKAVACSADRAVMIENALFGRKLVKICVFFAYGGVFIYWILVPLTAGKVRAEDGNFSYWPLLQPFPKVIVDARLSPVNEIFFALECVSLFVANTIGLAACSLAAVFSLHAYAQLELVMSWLKQLTNLTENTVESVSEQFAIIVAKHVQTLHFIALLQNVLNEVSIFEIVSSTLSLCFLGYNIIMEWEDGQFTAKLAYVTMIVSIGFNMFVYCYLGELMFEQCTKVGDSSYMIEWYRLLGRQRLNLILISARSKCSSKLAAGHMFELCLRGFGNIVKSSVAYLNLLRAVGS